MFSKPVTAKLSALALFAWANIASLCQAQDLPTVSDLLLETPFSEKHITQVLAGEIAASKIVPVSKSELAQGVACLVTIDALEKLDTLQGATWLAPEKLILSSGEIADQASLSDFEAIQLHPQHEDEAGYFINAKAGEKLNLSPTEIQQFNELKASTNKPLQPVTVDTLIQNILLTRHQQYRENGLSAIAPYARSKKREVQPGQQLLTSLNEALALKKLYPDVFNMLEQYPRTIDSTFTEDYFWYMVNLDDRPAIGLSHRLHINMNDARFIIERGYYISHSLDSVQIIVALVPVQEGLLLFYTNRTWTGKITGMFNFLKRRIGYNIMMHEMEHVMKNLNICGQKE
jgi:hypothetical protein